jgi:hypothetical protein
VGVCERELAKKNGRRREGAGARGAPLSATTRRRQIFLLLRGCTRTSARARDRTRRGRPVAGRAPTRQAGSGVSAQQQRVLTRARLRRRRRRRGRGGEGCLRRKRWVLSFVVWGNRESESRAREYLCVYVCASCMSAVGLAFHEATAAPSSGDPTRGSAPPPAVLPPSYLDPQHGGTLSLPRRASVITPPPSPPHTRSTTQANALSRLNRAQYCARTA